MTAARAMESDWESNAEAVRPARILLADADGEVRTFLSETLQAEGYEVTEVADGGALRELLRASRPGRGTMEPFDLLIADTELIDDEAMAELGQLRRQGFVLPAILMTEGIDESEREEAMRAGATAILERPFSVEELLMTALLAHDLEELRSEGDSSERLRRLATKWMKSQPFQEVRREVSEM